jgi:phosphoribosylformylglycinamidine synthase
MLSESQERMLLVVEPDHIDRVQEIVERWSLDAQVIGAVTDDGRITVREADEVVAEIPALLFTDGCPTYEPAAVEDPAAAARRSFDLSAVPDIGEQVTLDTPDDLLLWLLSSLNVGSRRWIYEQFDHTILTNTVVPPGAGDAAVLRLKGTNRGIAVALDCNSRYCFLDPELGARHAVAEACRNVACSGGRPLAVTNCLNFGNPQKPGGAFQLRQAVLGIAAACNALGVPVVSGNVSLYNESGGTAVMPTPTIGVVGVLDDLQRHATMRWEPGQVILLLGGMPPTLGGSEYLAVVYGVVGGSPPQLDLELEWAVQRVLHEAIAEGILDAAHDCAEGGFAVTLAEMAIASGTGAVIEAPLPAGRHGRRDEALFGEAASSIVVSLPASNVAALGSLCERNNVPLVELGTVGGDSLIIGDEVRVALGSLQASYASAFDVMEDGSSSR